MAEQSKSIVSTKNILETQAYKKLPIETQLKLTEFLVQKNFELSQKEKEYFLEHLSSDKDTRSYLAFLEEQNSIQRNAKGVNITYNSYETKTPTGKISSKTTTATASGGCLIPVIIFLLIFGVLL
mgnify:FL=1